MVTAGDENSLEKLTKTTDYLRTVIVSCSFPDTGSSVVLSQLRVFHPFRRRFQTDIDTFKLTAQFHIRYHTVAYYLE